MRDQFILAILKSLEFTPLTFNQWLGRRFGKLAWRFSKKHRHIALTNLELCYPEQSEDWRLRMGKFSTQAMFEAMLESPKLWVMPGDKLMQRCVNPESFDDIKSAHAENKGLIVSSPHLGSWEYLGLFLGQQITTTSLYRPPKITAIDQLMRTGRSHTGATLVPTTASGIKSLTQAIRQNECIGLLPDQEATRGNGVFANFFGVPAYTMHLLPRMAQRSQSPVYFVITERLRKGKFKLHVIKNEMEIYDKDTKTACTSMNHSVEQLVRICPEQYNWCYKRFSLKPDDTQRY